jgi:hypothetical protein
MGLIPVTRVDERSLRFPEQLTFIHRKAHIAHPEKLKIIQNVRIQTEKIEQTRFMNFKYENGAQTKDKFFEFMRSKRSQLF